jgi:hypothetical protein
MTRATTVEKTLAPPCGKEVVFLGWRPTVAGCLIAGFVQLLVGYLFYKAVPAVIPDVERQYKNGALFRPWPGWTSTYMLFHPIGFGAVFALVYCGLKSRCGFPAGWRGGGAFGACVFLVGSLPIFLIDYASFAVSVEIVASWILQNACQYLLSGASVGIVANLRGMVDRSP